MATALFDSWTDKYDAWFATPIGQLVRWYESELLLTFLTPKPGEAILDVGCGTGIFTADVLKVGAQVVGVDLSSPMLRCALTRGANNFSGVCADMRALPFDDNSFDRVFSMTAIEFVADGAKAIEELNRVIKPGGRGVVTSLNSLSPWAEQRLHKATTTGHSLFDQVHFRSPREMCALVPYPTKWETAIHFLRQEAIEQVESIEEAGKKQKLDTGAFVAICWDKPKR